MNTDIKESEITITAKAIDQIKKVKSESNIPENFALRVGVKGGGCSGFTYTLGFDASSKEGDTVIETDGITLLVDGKSLFYLSGTQLDYTDGLDGRGFIFSNPNAAKNCGCGSSFGV